MANTWLQFPQFVSETVTLRKDGVDTTYTVHPVNTLDGTNLGLVNNELIITEVFAQLTNLNPKASNVALWVRVFYDEDDGTQTQVLSYNERLDALWNPDGVTLSGDFVFHSMENIIDMLGTLSGQFHLHIATPITWVDCVQCITRFTEFSVVDFEYNTI